MARPPLGLGKHGSIRITRESGQWVARCRFRQLNGHTVRVERWGSSKTAATTNLQDELRNRAGERTTMLSASSRFADATEIYLLKIAERRAASTYDLYRYWTDTVVLPALGELRIHECDVARLDAYFTDLQRRGYAANTRRTLRAIVSGTMQQAVLSRSAPANPVRELERIEEPKGKRKAQSRGLTIEERRRLLGWLCGTSDDPKVARSQKVARSADLPDLIRFALGTGLRIGEVCGVRICDLDLDGVPVVSGDDIRLVPIVAVRGKVCYVKGKGLVRSDTGKTAAALRIIPLPGFVTAQLHARLTGGEDPMWPLFAAAGADGRPTFRWPSNVRRSIRAVREEVGLGWMTPHTWRRTYATILHDEMGLSDRQKADLMGHAKITMMKDVYVHRGELHAEAAVYLDAAYTD
ncbi:MAG: tyrosine-type recombinase/integrase [Pseudonocardiaceae bacterium]